MLPEVFEVHKERIKQRAAHENREASYQMLIDDVYAVCKGRLVGRSR
jgi:methylaspartate mutase epsilon subunit